MSLAAFSIWDIIGVPRSKEPISVATFVSYVLPPVTFYFVMAVLAITPRTRVLRIAMWPVLALLALRAVFSVDLAPSSFERKFHNDLGNPMLMIVTRSLYWAWTKEPLVRRLRPVNSTRSTLLDAVDLAFAFRGYGWDWSRETYIPRENRPSNPIGFVSYAALSAVVHAFICGTSHRALRSFSPPGLGSISGASIFDETLPIHVRYLRSTIITLIGGGAIYGLLQMGYDVCTVLGVLFLRQDSAQWPPGFDQPWRATSLSQFWGRRWHQWLRHMFLTLGGHPLSFIFGRVGLVVGAFLASAVYHYVGIHALDSTSELWRQAFGFGMMAPGIFAEQVFKRLTGRKVCGFTGWLWTYAWLLFWGSWIMDGFMRAGLFRASALIDGVPVLRELVERSVTDFDTWLHTL